MLLYVSTSGALAKLVIVPPCHGGDHGFESRTHRHVKNKAQQNGLFCLSIILVGTIVGTLQGTIYLSC